MLLSTKLRSCKIRSRRWECSRSTAVSTPRNSMLWSTSLATSKANFGSIPWGTSKLEFKPYTHTLGSRPLLEFRICLEQSLNELWRAGTASRWNTCSPFWKAMVQLRFKNLKLIKTIKVVKLFNKLSQSQFLAVKLQQTTVATLYSFKHVSRLSSLIQSCIWSLTDRDKKLYQIST